MKKKVFKIVCLFTFLAVLFSACKKYDDILTPKPQPPAKSNMYQFVVASLPGEAPEGIGDVYALVSVAKANGEEVVKDKKLPLTFNGKYSTEKLELPDGAYRLTKFFIINGNNITRFAAPVANAPKAALVQKPLAISFLLPQTTVVSIPVEVLRIAVGDAPESYGYPTGSFTEVTIEEPETFINVKLKAVVKVGDVTYDSIPAALTLASWDKKGQVHRKEITLNAGTNALTLPASHTKYILSVTKWGIRDEMTLMRNEVQEGMVYVLGGSKAAKKLASEETYQYEYGSYKLKSKMSFEYNSAGKLQQVKHYVLRASQTTMSLAFTDQFYYNGNVLDRVEKYDHVNNKSMGTYQAFQYDAQGRMSEMVQTYLTDRTAIKIKYSTAGNTHIITADLLDRADQPAGVTHKYHFNSGNKIEESSTGAMFSSRTTYTYDFNINPYVHMQRPDLQFAGHSKNNVLTHNYLSSTSWGSMLGGNFSYQNTYDAEGYPTEMVRISKVVNDFPVSKTIYTYY